MPDNAFYQQQSVTDIIGREPAWIVSSGIGLITLITSILLAITWFIQYPDSLIAPVELQTSQATVKHRSALNGHLNKILFKEGDLVQKGQPLMLIESQLDYSELNQLQDILEHWSTLSSVELLRNNIAVLAKTGQWGSLQDDFNNLIYQLEGWQRLNEDRSLQHKESSTKFLSEKYQNLISQLKEKQQTTLNQLDLAQNELALQQELANKGLLASSELIQARQRYFNQHSKQIDSKVNIEEYQMKLSELQQELTARQLTQQQSMLEKKANVEQQRLLLLSKIKQWQLQHLILARSSGHITFNQSLKPYQFVRQDQVIFSITPPGKRMDAWMKVNGKGLGKLKPGLKVQITLESFPAAEFGILEAQVYSFSPIPDQEGYLVKLTLPEKLISSHGISLNGHPYMKGSGKIITQSKRLLTRFVDNISYAFSKVSSD